MTAITTKANGIDIKYKDEADEYGQDARRLAGKLERGAEYIDQIRAARAGRGAWVTLTGEGSPEGESVWFDEVLGWGVEYVGIHEHTGNFAIKMTPEDDR